MLKALIESTLSKVALIAVFCFSFTFILSTLYQTLDNPPSSETLLHCIFNGWKYDYRDMTSVFIPDPFDPPPSDYDAHRYTYLKGNPHPCEDEYRILKISFFSALFLTLLCVTVFLTIRQ